MKHCVKIATATRVELSVDCYQSFVLEV